MTTALLSMMDIQSVSPRILSNILDYLPLTDKFILRRVCQDWNDALSELLKTQSFLMIVPHGRLNERNNFWSDIGYHAIPSSLTLDQLHDVLKWMTNVTTMWCEDSSFFTKLIPALIKLHPSLQLETLQGVMDHTALFKVCHEHEGCFKNLESLTIEYRSTTTTSWNFECFEELPNLTSLIINADDKDDDSVANRFTQTGMVNFLEKRRQLNGRPSLYVKVTQKGAPLTTRLIEEINWHRINGNVAVNWVVTEEVGHEHVMPPAAVPVILNIHEMNAEVPWIMPNGLIIHDFGQEDWGQEFDNMIHAQDEDVMVQFLL